MTSQMEFAIRFGSVSKSFGTVRAVEALDFEAPTGAVTVLLGPNGAGKTTTVRLATGALVADRGNIEVLGLHPKVDGDEVRRRVGIVPPKPAFYDQLTGWENLRFAAQIFGADEHAALDAAERFAIDHALLHQVGGYSTGMRTRLALARSVIHDPEVLLLDEPTAGLDPESSRNVLKLIRELAGRGRTIVLCTHLLHEAEGIADQIVLMSKGHAQVSGSPEELTSRYLADPVVLFDAEDRSTLDSLIGRDGVLSVSPNGAVHATIADLDALPDLIAELVRDGVRLTRVEPIKPTLEELYFEMQRTHREVPS
ncbi:MAG: ABC transporter ATP-binding protein [Actinomycetota bacterium]|nr:ABC transporter ATP-binding protein [Actinomycetota bacterium]